MINKKIILVSTVILSIILLSSCMDNDKRQMSNSKGLENHEKMEGNIQENMKKNMDDNERHELKSKNIVGTGSELVNKILTDDKGMTLYIFTKDKKNISNCSGECEKKWSVFYNSSLKTNGYSSIKREDGKMQTTFNGQPLYYFFKDEKAGDMNGQGLKNVWFTIEVK